MTNSNSMTNISSRPHVWWIQDVLGKAHLCCNTWLHAALVQRAQCEQDKEQKKCILSCRTPIRIHASTLRAETLRIRSVCLSLWPPLLTCTQTFHMNWFMKLLWIHSFAHFKFEDIFLSHQKVQAQLSHPSDRIPTAKADMFFCYLHT